MCGRLSSWFVFFFQAEDGIRDLVRSRGLGDVYKRQVGLCLESAVGGHCLEARCHVSPGGPDPFGLLGGGGIRDLGVVRTSHGERRHSPRGAR